MWVKCWSAAGSRFKKSTDVKIYENIFFYPADHGVFFKFVDMTLGDIL